MWGILVTLEGSGLSFAPAACTPGLALLMSERLSCSGREHHGQGEPGTLPGARGPGGVGPRSQRGSLEEAASAGAAGQGGWDLPEGALGGGRVTSTKVGEVGMGLGGRALSSEGLGGLGGVVAGGWDPGPREQRE